MPDPRIRPSPQIQPSLEEVEHALVVALMAFGVAASLQAVASGINGEFVRMSASVVSYIPWPLRGQGFPWSIQPSHLR
jgi:Flp pilus assembly pilin Flp